MAIRATCYRCLIISCFFVGSAISTPLAAVPANPQKEGLTLEGFQNPPLEARPGAFWAWLEGHVSLERITFELEEMKDKGMGGADIWDVHAYINPDGMIPAGPTFMGDASVKAIAHTLREAKRLGLSMGMVAASGWNAGGRWVKPADAGMGLFHSQISVEGPATLSRDLPFPEVPKECPKAADGRPLFSRDVTVLAVPQEEGKTLESTNSVIDVSRYCDRTGHLNWDVPAGKWTILRFIMSNTGYQLIAQTPNSGGPMIDFLNPESTRMHFGTIMDRLEAELGDLNNFPLDHLEVDSMELGSQTIWTGQIMDRFRKAYGYDPLKYLPLLTGWDTKDAEVRKRFLYDWKKLISDVFIDNHYRTGSAFLREHGVKLCAEAGGPGAPIWDSCPVDSLKALGAVDIPRGEFWPKMRNIWLVKEISSAAHIYGKTLVDAESFTSWRHLQDGPYFYKLMADKAMSEGLNHFTFHTFAHSPKEAGLPGNYYHAGTHINPNRVWWPMAGPFIEYLSRCCYVLQKGLFVADACYYYGDQAPNFVSAKGVDYCPGDGYDYDVCNSDVILNRMTVKQGRITLPDGMSYAVLVLPERRDMDLDVLQKLTSLVKAGATVIGPKPDQTGTLVDYPERDGRITRLADTLWGACDGQSVKEHAYGKGRVVWNRSVADVLQSKGIGPDFQYTGCDKRTQLDYVHRRTDKEDIYFVINLNERWETAECAFRVTGKRPQLWYPETGQLSEVPAYDIQDGVTRLTLHLKPAESVFVVFREPVAPVHFTRIETLAAQAAAATPVFSPHSATPGGPMWLSDGKTDVADQSITFDLGDRYDLKKIRVWNYIESVRGFMNYGVKDLEILASAEGTDFRTCGTFSLNEASQTEDKDYYQDLDVKIDRARYVRFDAKTNHNTTFYSNGVSQHVGLCRVKFFGDNEISNVKIHSVSSGVAFDPASDDIVGSARPDAALKTDASDRPYLRVWTPGTYVLHRTGGSSESIEVQSVTRPVEITGPWQVSFPQGWGAPDQTTFDKLISWTESKEDGIKYFSGRAVYHKAFAMPKAALGEHAYVELDLGVVQKVARVSLNGRDIAVLWKPPFSVDITNAVKPGQNELVVEVANTWTNRLIGDAFLPPEKQFCKTNLHDRLSRKDRPLQPSGLLGPVTIHTASDVYGDWTKNSATAIDEAKAVAGKTLAEPLPIFTQGRVDDISKSVTYADGRLNNGIISVEFDYQQGLFSIRDAQSGEVLLAEARFGLPSEQALGSVRLMTVEDVQDRLGMGKRMILEVVDRSVLRYYERARRLFSYTLYENNPALVFGFGLKTPNYFSMRLRQSEPLAGAHLFGGRPMERPMTLNGAAGAEKTQVTPGLSRSSANSLMLTGLIEGQRRTAVWGGLSYNEFGKFSTLEEGSPGFFAEDPVGRLVDEDQTYLATDTFYLDVHTQEPFDAMERYGRAMRLANDAHPNVYDFPVLCGWSVGHISHLPNVNNSARLIQELNHANQCGLTQYTQVALRLEPDKYHFDTEQGWWDDAHMRKFGHLVPPYDSIATWSKAMRAGNGIPYIYMQLGMPSDDFARQFPQYMLFNDASEVDKRVPGTTGKNKHPHNQPYVTYDYTDKAFSQYFVKTWRKLHDDGIRGVKVDYPATAWRPEGGFDDRYATCNGAYRRAFQLLRTAFGEDGFIDERNMGESGRPCLDVTAGLVDTQRTWRDSNKYDPAMISISGLRWYKNRTVFNYYPDTKAVHNLSPEIRQSMLTMVYLTSGRLDLATSFSLFTPEITHDVSRIYPHYPEPRTARPLDAFTGVLDPQVYDLELTPDWHQIALFNTTKETAAISTGISGQRVDNAVGLDAAVDYHAYEFWSDTYLGRLPGAARLARELGPNRCAMVSLRKAQTHPQVLSTNRHVLQGWVELKEVVWDAKARTLSGTAHVIGGEPMTIVVADNGARVLTSEARGGRSELKPHPVDGLSCLTLSAVANTDVTWRLKYE